MTSHRPYLLRALYEWISDNGMTPHLLVDAARPGVQVPIHAVKDGKIVLNVAERAVSTLEMGNDEIRFSARFGGVSQLVSVPIPAVLAIYARETGQGMALPDDIGADGSAGAQTNDEAEPARPVLSAVPSDPGDEQAADVSTVSEDNSTRSDGVEDGDDDPDSPTPRRGGHLRIVK